MPHEDKDKPDPWAEARRKGVYRPEGTAATGVDAATKEKYGTTAGKGLGSKAVGGFIPPKQEKDEDSTTYAKRVGKARRDYEAAQGQKKALTK